MPNRPDIAFFIHRLGGGGAERILVTLCNHFAEQGKKVHLVVMDKEGPYWDQLSPKVETICLSANRYWKAIWPLSRYLRRVRPPRLVCLLPFPNLIGLTANLLAFNACPIIVWEHGVYSYYANRRKGLTRYLAFRAPALYRLAQHIICVSQPIADDLMRLAQLSPQNISIIHNPAIRNDLAVMKAAPVDHPWLRPGQPPVLLVVAAFRPEKNYPLLLEAFAHIDPRYQAKLIILGDGPDRPLIERHIRELAIENRVSLEGFKDNPFAYMSKATALLLCSDVEGLPTVIIEALACGCPVIAGDCPGGVREVLKNSTYGRLVPPMDSRGLAAAINETLANPAEAKNKVIAFQQQQLSAFTPETVLPKFARIFGL